MHTPDMSRRGDPARIDAARHAATRNRLVGAGMSEETADRWLAAWADEAARQEVAAGTAAYWERGWDWIEAQREHRREP
jgi:hypothetical protein